MDLQKLNNGDTIEDDFPLPGFRFHPTDEELVGFYLRRKVEKKPISIELIKQIDIYKYDPWDLPKVSTVGEKEWYFYCRRGRKYRNSIRPNRVTSSGFWKATGIDRPIYSASAATGGANHECVGLKKSLVYYTGSARKGTKTDWMMHEFRLPTSAGKSTTDKSMPEVETWTICRIFKRNVTYKRHGEEAKPLQTNQIEFGRRQYLSGQAASLTALNRSDHQGMPPGESMIDFTWDDIRPILDRSVPAWDLLDNIRPILDRSEPAWDLLDNIRPILDRSEPAWDLLDNIRPILDRSEPAWDLLNIS